jgi:two-component system LytT family response regulator
MLRAIVIDDEKPSREALCNYIREYCDDIDIITTASSVKSSFRAIKKTKPDLLFLDIEMPDGNGFDLLGMFNHIDFKIIFVTAYSDYAVKAFRFSAVDYLLKPIKIEELIMAVERVRYLIKNETGNNNIDILINNFRAGANIPTLVIPHLKGFEVIKIQEIILCQAEGYCTNLFDTQNRKVVSSKNLKHFNELLEDHNFMRVHHSYLINLNHVTGFTRQGEIFLTGGHKAFLGDSYKNDFIQKLRKK